jgi:hypothetical protein
MSLRAIGVPGVLGRWIEVYMSTTHFSMAMNEESHVFSRLPKVFGMLIFYPFICLFWLWRV